MASSSASTRCDAGPIGTRSARRVPSTRSPRGSSRSSQLGSPCSRHTDSSSSRTAPAGWRILAPKIGPVGEISSAAARADSAAASPTRKRPPDRCTIARSPSRSCHGGAGRRSSTWLKSDDCNAETRNRSCRRSPRRRSPPPRSPRRIAAPRVALSPSRPNRWRPKRFGIPRRAISSRRSPTVTAPVVVTSRTTIRKRLPTRSPVRSLWTCFVASRTLQLCPPSASAAAGSTRGTENLWRVTAQRSLRPA